MKRPNKRELELISHATLKKTAEIGLAHAAKNAPNVRNTIKDLLGLEPKPSVVISAGPSLHKNGSLKKIKESGFDGYIVAVDGTLGHCLRNGLVPDFVISVDPHPDRIVRWFGDTKIEKRNADNYFKRQDLDPALNENEVSRNKELIYLVNRHGRDIKAVLSTSVAPDITERCMEAGMEMYWWNPLYDDYETPGSYSKKVREITGAPCMVTGGNCGTSAWVFAHAILKSPEIILVGMDLSYPPGTPVERVQYYEELKELFPGNPAEGLIKIYNPYLRQTWFTDPAYYWYSRVFLEMAKHAACRTYNCTEGGILFGDKIIFTGLTAAFKKVKS